MAIDADILSETDFPIRLERSHGVDVARLDFSKAQRGTIISLCGQTESINRAMREVYGSPHLPKWVDTAIYVVMTESDGSSKIGISRNPMHRLACLQVGNPEALRVSHLFWLPRDFARIMEAASLDAASRMGIRMAGEWVRGSSITAACIITEMLRAVDAPVSTSAMFVQNLRNMFPSDDVTSMRGRVRVKPEEEIIRKIDHAA